MSPYLPYPLHGVPLATKPEVKDLHIPLIEIKRKADGLN